MANRSPQPHDNNGAPFDASRGDVTKLRHALGLDREQLARLLGESEQPVAELWRLRKALSLVMKAEFIPRWFTTPNDAFDGLRPLDLAQRGETERLLQMVEELESGMPG